MPEMPSVMKGGAYPRNHKNICDTYDSDIHILGFLLVLQSSCTVLWYSLPDLWNETGAALEVSVCIESNPSQIKAGLLTKLKDILMEGILHILKKNLFQN